MDNVPSQLQSHADISIVLARLQDLASFGIDISRPVHNGRCCRCGASTQGFSEGYGFDNLCERCKYGAPFNYNFSRLQGEIYTNETIYVSRPVEGYSYLPSIWNGVKQDHHYYMQMFGLVKINSRPYLLRTTSNTSDLHNMDGVLLEMYGFTGIGYAEMERLLETQRPL